MVSGPLDLGLQLNWNGNWTWGWGCEWPGLDGLGWLLT